MSNTVLVVAAHPDDEVLMCGGTIAKTVAKGGRVDILFLSDGETARFTDAADGNAAPSIEARKQAARAAAALLGAEPPRFLDLPDNRLDSLALLDIVKQVEAHVRDVQPETVITHSIHDLNIDHQIANKAVATACRPLPGRSVRAIYAAETLSASEWSLTGRFAPVRYVDIGDHMELKIKALRCYGDEIPPAPHPRSEDAVRSLARVRGAEAGLFDAEAFEVIREIQ